MSNFSRRKLIVAGLGAVAGASGLAAARRSGLIPPDHGGLYGAGETLTYAAQRVLTRHSLAREFTPSQISTPPFANSSSPRDEEYKRLQAGGFADWRLAVNGMVARPMSFSVSDLQRYPSSTQITHLACEEGWSYIAQWTGAPLSTVLDAVGVLPQARYVVYFSQEKGWWDSIDMADAVHPQTLVAYGMNGGELPPAFGGPLRMRVPRQLGYKSVKFINLVILTDNLKPFGKGLGSAAPEDGYAWYAGI